MYKQYSVFISFLFLYSFPIFAQLSLDTINKPFWVINTAGQYVSTEDHEVSFFIGESFIENRTNNDIHVTEGLLQSYLISPQLISSNNDSVICKGASIDIHTKSLPNYSFAWSIVENDIDTIQTSQYGSTFSIFNFQYNKATIIAHDPSFPNIPSGHFTIYAEDLTRCEIDLRIYELITPNQDDQNEFFFIEGIQKLANNEVFLFNKWGNIMYRQKNYENQYSPIDLEDGEYIYVIKDQDKNKTYTGNLIIRK